MPKEPKPNFASFTKAELVKTVKKLDARQTKLLNRIAELEGQLAPATHALRLARAATHEPGPVTNAEIVARSAAPGPYDVVHVTQGPDAVSELVPPPPRSVQDALNAMDTPRVYSDAAALRDEWEREMPKPAFPWEKE